MEIEKWYTWTNKSDGVPFKSTQSGVGHGEKKIASEFETTIAGKNVSFDFHPSSIGGISKAIEVKTLDKDNSFRIGVTSLINCTKVIQLIIKLFDSIILIESKLCNDSKLRSTFSSIKREIYENNQRSVSLYKCFMKSEVSVSNIQKTQNIISNISKIYYDHNVNSQRKHTVYDPISGLKKYLDSKSYLRILEAFGYDNDQNKVALGMQFESGIVTYYLCDVIDKFKENICDIFTKIINMSLNDVEVIIVNNDGYKWINKDNITFNRLTNG